MLFLLLFVLVVRCYWLFSVSAFGGTSDQHRFWVCFLVQLASKLELLLVLLLLASKLELLLVLLLSTSHGSFCFAFCLTVERQCFFHFG